MTARTGTVYVMKDPRNGLIRYVGATVTTLPNRLSGHLSTARCEEVGSSAATWIRDLLNEGLKPEISALRVVPVSQMLEVEREEIARHYDEGWPLTNVKDSPGSEPFNAERKLAAAQRRVDRLAGVDARLHAQAVQDAESIEASLRAHQAEIAARLAREAARNPSEEADYEAAIWLLLNEWNASEMGLWGGEAPLAQDDLDCLADVLLELAKAGRRRGVPFRYIVHGVGPELVRDMRCGRLVRKERQDEAA